MKETNKALFDFLNENNESLSGYNYVVIGRDVLLQQLFALYYKEKYSENKEQKIYTYLLTKNYLEAEKSKEIMREDGFRNIKIYNVITEKVPIRKGLNYLRFIKEAHWSDNHKKKRFRFKKRKGVEL